MKNLYKKLVIIQILVDYLSVIISFILGYLLWKIVRPGIPFHLILYLKLAIPAGFTYVFVFWLIKLYKRDISFLNVEQLRRIIKGWIIGSGVLFAVGFFYKEFSFSRLTLIFTVIILIFLIIIQRNYFFILWKRLHQKGIGVYKAIVIGADSTAISIFNVLIHSPWFGIVPIGFVDDKKDEIVDRDKKIYSRLGKTDHLEDIIKIHKIEQAIIAYSVFTYEQLQKILLVCYQYKLQIKMIPHFYNVLVQNVQVENLIGIPLLSINTSRPGKIYFFVKRYIDVIVSAVILLCCLPLMLVLMVFIKLGSKGPFLFSQERVGQDGKAFKIYKFRSMYVKDSKYEKCPESLNDQRITRIGRFLRKTSMDELPQFINVLKGDMSIVGPRPEMKFIVDEYDDIQRERLKVKPGITGLWQISHRRGSPIHENVDYDIYYIENQSFTLDLAIILSTFSSVYKGAGAY